MRPFLSLALVFAASAGAGSAAPVPTEKPSPGIDGRYTLLSVSSPADRMNAAGPGFIGGPGGRIVARGVTPSAYLVGPATITKHEISFEGRGLPAATAAIYGITPGNTTLEYTLDSTKMTIDVTTADLRGKKTKSLGLVEVVGDRLIIAVAKEGDERPKSTEEAGDVTVYYFQKAPPPPKTEVRILVLTVGKEEATEKELNKLLQDGFELVSTTAIAPADSKAPVATTVHFVLKRTPK
jgi:hypothetical protein